MRMKFMRTAIVAGTAAVAGLATAAPALGSPVPTVQVPCRVSALASAISGARAARCCGWRPARTCWPVPCRRSHTRLTLQGSTATTIERSYAGGIPHFSLLTVGVGGNLTVTNVNFTNGYALDEGGAIYGVDGPVSVTGGTFTGNYSSQYGGRHLERRAASP